MLSVWHWFSRSILFFCFGSGNVLVTLFLVRLLVFMWFARIFCNDKPYRYWSMMLLSFLKLSPFGFWSESARLVSSKCIGSAIVGKLVLVPQLVFCVARVLCDEQPFWSMILLSFLQLVAISSTPVSLVKFVKSFRIRQRCGNIVPSTTTRFSVFCDTFLWWQTLLICDSFELFKAECYQFDTGMTAEFCANVSDPPTLW